MSTRFEQIVDAIKAQLDVNFPGNGIKFFTGLKARSLNEAVNQVVWVRTGGRSVEVDGIGPGKHDSEQAPGTEVASAAILTDQYDVEADVWGCDQETADSIRVAVIRAAHNAASNRSIESSRWHDLLEDDNNEGLVTYGAAHRIEFIFRVPILDVQEQALALITSDETTEVFVTAETFTTTIANQLDLTSPP